MAVGKVSCCVPHEKLNAVEQLSLLLGDAEIRCWEWMVLSAAVICLSNFLSPWRRRAISIAFWMLPELSLSGMLPMIVFQL